MEYRENGIWAKRSSILLAGIWFYDVFAPNDFCDIQLQQGFCQRLASVPVMIFGVSSEGNDDVTIGVNIRVVRWDHVVDSLFHFFQESWACGVY